MCDRISGELKKQYPKVEWHKIKGFRNMIAHDYLGIDAEEVWQIISDDIIPLRARIEEIANDVDKMHG